MDRSQFKVENSAVENWARLNNIDTTFDDARRQLLDAIEKEELNGSPDWMTSVSDEDCQWINFSNRISLMVVEKSTDGYNYLVKKAVAPKGVRRQAEKLGQPLPRNLFTEQAIKEIQQLPPAELVNKLRVSLHALEQIEKRTQQKFTEEDILLLAEDGEVIYPPPFWADASRRGDPVLLVNSGDDVIAFPLAYGEEKLTLTTAIPEKWSRASLFDLRGEALLQQIYLPSGYDNEGIREAIIASSGVQIGEKFTLNSLGKRIVLRPADSIQRAQRTNGKPWFIESVEQLTD